MKPAKDKIWKCVKIVLAVMLTLILMVILLLLPFIIDKVYDYTPPTEFFDIELSKSDILDYYAQLLSLSATIILGVIAVVQTYRSQKKSDEINELQLSIARQELAVVEKQYMDEKSTTTLIVPKFEIKIVGYSGWYSNIKLEIRNISETIISAFRFISFDVYRNEEMVCSVKRWKIKFQSIASAETQSVDIFTPSMCDNNENTGKGECWENVKLVWKFSCDDCQGNKHFYSAHMIIPNTKSFSGAFWETTKIG